MSPVDWRRHRRFRTPQGRLSPFTAVWRATVARGAAPKPGIKLGHSPQAGRVTAPGDGETKSWTIPQHPDGAWSPQALEWWRLALASPSSALWTESDRPKLERAVWMIDRWWSLTITNPAEAMRMADQVRRAEEELYLSPKARASAGIVVDKKQTPATSGNARSRLVALRGGDAVDAG